MKKIVDFVNSIYLNRLKNEDVQHSQKINYWCPTGMTPVFHDSENCNF